MQEGEDRKQEAWRPREGAVRKVNRVQHRRHRSRLPPPTAGRRAQHPLRRLQQQVTYHNLRDAVGCVPL